MVALPPKTNKTLALIGKLFAAIFVVAVLVWFLIISPLLIRQEKSRFESAATELEKLAQEIQAKIGPAQSAESQKSCDRPNLKSSKGPLSCDVKLDLSYGTLAPEQATLLMEKTSLLFNTPVRQGIGFSSSSREANVMNFHQNNKDSFRSFFQDLPNKSELSCGAAYEYSWDSESAFIISVSCGGSARAEYYPLANQ